MVLLLFPESRMSECRFPERQFSEYPISPNCPFANNFSIGTHYYHNFMHFTMVNEPVIWYVTFLILLALIPSFSVVGIFGNMYLVKKDQISPSFDRSF